jgi:hypothetical protein
VNCDNFIWKSVFKSPLPPFIKGGKLKERIFLVSPAEYGGLRGFLGYASV